ncbi:ATP-binding protein [Paracoccus sp. TK19116]|uniref:histidine kinase n=1 Tax=Paracoccus albicereus TaxID=2922394 RepID=A0ABT1MQJ7_9RHOB|nr:ATP-binding protein [Paracoccus albicereus]MCQ0969603.1 ATP-binding protein [Paracoccus albicereus]
MADRVRSERLKGTWLRRDGARSDLAKRILPRGIYGRAALILVLPIVTLLLVVSVMFLQRHFEGVTRQMTASMAQEIALVARRIERAEGTETAGLAGESIAAPLGLTLRLPDPDAAEADARKFYDLSGRVVIEELRAEIPQIRAVDLTTDYKRVAITMIGPFGPYSLGFERKRVSASNPHQLLVLMAVTAMLMSGIAIIFLRNQLRPIKRLATAAEEYGRGRVVPYRIGGAAEVRSAGAAFLDMRNRIERSNEQRKLMLSGISHDLRTPLTRLKLGLSMMSPDLPPDEADLVAMESDIAEMTHMVEAFLDFARDEAQDGPPQRLPALPFVRALVGDAQRAGQAVSLSRIEGDETAAATFRPDTLRRAVENLIGNAVRYGSLAEVDAILGARSFVIAVEDDGPGIPEDRRDEAMRPFTRLDPARNRDQVHGGAGLGLSIAADVARAHGGQLRLGRGALLGGLRAEIVLPR